VTTLCILFTGATPRLFPSPIDAHNHNASINSEHSLFKDLGLSRAMSEGNFNHQGGHRTSSTATGPLSNFENSLFKDLGLSRAMSDGNCNQRRTSSNDTGPLHRRTSSTATGPLSKRLQRRSSEGPLSQTETVSEQFIRRPSHSTSPPSRKIFSSGTAFYSRIVEQQANDRHSK